MIRKLVYLSILPVLFSLSPVFGITRVYFQNNTTFNFSISTTRSGAYLAGDRWGQSTNAVTTGQRAQVVWFNRDTGITSGSYFYFNTNVTNGSSVVTLRQALLGQWVGSHMWQSLSGYGFNHPWYDDRSNHIGTYYINGKLVEVKYRAFFTGSDDNIEYIFREAHTVVQGGADTLNVLAYNVYMRPTTLFANGQSIRAGLIPAQVKGYDAIVFSEAFDDTTRAKLLSGLAAEYPYRTNIVGTDRGVEQDGGVILVSRWPIEVQDQMRYGATCAGSDCMADKGAIYARINKLGRKYHVFGTHTQAWATAEGQSVRRSQFALLRNFILSKNVPFREAVIIAGDLNVDKTKYYSEFTTMLSILHAAHPQKSGYGYSYDPTTNRLAAAGPSEYLDYVLYSTDNVAPTYSYNEVRMLRSLEEWKEFVWEYAYWDLSDHYSMYGRLEFAPQQDVYQLLIPYLTTFSF